MNRKYLLVSILFLALFQVSCFKSKVDTGCSYSSCQFVAPASEIQAISNYLTLNSLTATQHCSGVFYNITNAGTGKQPNACKTITVKYIGKLTNGNVFDQQVTSAVQLYLLSVINGWRIGIPLLKEGGSITLYIPPYLGYGAQDVKDTNGNVVIPANSIIVFNIDLVTVI